MKLVGLKVDVAVSRLVLARLQELGRRFGDWWLKEFLNLFPERVAEFLAGRGQTMLVVTVDGPGATLELLRHDFVPISSRPVSRPDSTMKEIDTFLRACGLEREAVQVGLRLPPAKVFGRQLVVPAEAMRAMESIVAQDLARKTPFKPDDVFVDHAIVERIGSSKLRISQWVARREDVRSAATLLKIAVEDLTFLTFGQASASEAQPVIRLRQEASVARAWPRKAMMAACSAGLLLAVAAYGLKYWNQQSALDRLDTEIADMSRKAQQVRLMVDQLQEKKGALLRIRMQRSDVPRVIDLWEEVTRILPSHSWLSEFKVAETAGGRAMQINLSGLSGAAPSLVGIVDRSPLFVDASLSAPVTQDPAEGRERFALQANVKRLDFVKGEAR